MFFRFSATFVEGVFFRLMFLALLLQTLSSQLPSFVEDLQYSQHHFEFSSILFLGWWAPWKNPPLDHHFFLKYLGIAKLLELKDNGRKESGLTYGVYPAHGRCTPESPFKVKEIRGAALWPNKVRSLEPELGLTC